MYEAQDIPICRICLNQIDDTGELMSIDEYAKTLLFENLLLKDMMEKCIPEMDLDICENAVMCTGCYDLLIATYTFRTRCLETEERLYLYIERNNMKLGEKIELRDVLNNKIGDDNNNKISEEISKVNVGQASEEENVIGINVTGSDSDLDEINIIDSDGDNENGRNSCSNDTDPTCTAMPSAYSLRKGNSCRKCGYRTYHKDLLYRHLMRNCEDETGFLYNCDLCPYGTFKKTNLTKHMLNHENKGPYVCGVCNEGFSTKRTIKDHMSTHSCYKLPYKYGSDGNPKPFMCKLCSRAFHNETQWDDHMDSEHGLHF